MIESWRPSAAIETLKARAELSRSVRAFFYARGITEVTTPLLSRHGTVDKHIDSFEVPGGGWLHTSPEFAMKRLLAAGSGPIYQMVPVFRREESGRHHNPEFQMLEWYRPGFDHHRLMDEVAELLAAVGGPVSCERLSYREAFRREAGFDPFTAPLSRLREGVQVPMHFASDDHDDWLDLWMSQVVGPKLGQAQPCLLYDFPASQAALARVHNGVAQRFELFWKGIELANGFHELTDAAEQEQRFKNDAEWRRTQGKKTPAYDANLVAALQSGLPPCAGVALGIDRLLMLLLKLPTLSQTLSFDSDHA